jgi:hypothetical protein
MAIAPAKQGRAYIVGAIDKENILSRAEPPGNRVVIFHESRAVALADIGQYARR